MSPPTGGFFTPLGGGVKISLAQAEKLSLGDKRYARRLIQ